jgi:hypothetical protein
MKFLPTMALAAAALSGLSLDARAGGAGAPEPGSLLVFPCFTNSRGDDSIVTVTNTNGDMTEVGNQLAGTVDVEFVYINGENCQEFNRTRRLTPNDSLTVSVRLDNPNEREGYIYVFAKSPTTGQAISWNHLAGILRFFDGGITDNDWDANPYVYKAIPAQGAATDVNSDGKRDMDGVEYELSPDVLLHPRFVGQDSDERSTLVLLNLTGSLAFTAIVDILLYNDNEEVFSAQYAFQCWEKVHLSYISGSFTEDFLESTNDNPLEHVNGDEYGWFRLDGGIAFSTADSETDPAILSLLIEDIGVGDGGELPFCVGTQDNGNLLNKSPFVN